MIKTCRYEMRSKQMRCRCSKQALTFEGAMFLRVVRYDSTDQHQQKETSGSPWEAATGGRHFLQQCLKERTSREVGFSAVSSPLSFEKQSLASSANSRSWHRTRTRVNNVSIMSPVHVRADRGNRGISHAPSREDPARSRGLINGTYLRRSRSMLRELSRHRWRKIFRGSDLPRSSTNRAHATKPPRVEISLFFLPAENQEDAYYSRVKLVRALCAPKGASRKKEKEKQTRVARVVPTSSLTTARREGQGSDDAGRRRSIIPYALRRTAG